MTNHSWVSNQPESSQSERGSGGRGGRGRRGRKRREREGKEGKEGKREHSVLPLQYMYIRGNRSLVCKVLALFLGQSTDVCQMK